MKETSVRPDGMIGIIRVKDLYDQYKGDIGGLMSMLNLLC